MTTIKTTPNILSNKIIMETPKMSTRNIVTEIRQKKSFSKNGCNQDSLESFVKHICAKLKNLAQTNKYPKFTMKFNSANVNGDWDDLTKKLLFICKQIDVEYCRFNYVELKQKIITTMLNIVVSYILIGKNSSTGFGIVMNSDKTVEQMTNEFLDKLLMTMKIVYDLQLTNNQKDIVHEKYIKDTSNLKMKLENLKISLKKLNKDNSDEQLKLQTELSECSELISTKEKEIEKIIQSKKDTNEKLSVNINKIFNLNFVYYMHDLYFPELDCHIL